MQGLLADGNIELVEQKAHRLVWSIHKLIRASLSLRVPR
jgi:hypothetical protein